MDLKDDLTMALKREAAERLRRDARQREDQWLRAVAKDRNAPKASVPGSVRRKLAKAQREGGDGR